MVVIFDFDGTIANTFPLVVGIVNRLSESFGYEKISEDEIEKVRNMKIGDLRGFLKLSWMQVPIFLMRVRQELFNQIGLLRPVFGIEDLIAELDKKKVTLGMITSNREEVVSVFVKKYFVEKFSFIHTGTSIFGKHKVLSDVLAHYHLAKDEVVYVGDELRDIEAAKKVGVRVVSVTWGFQARELLEKACPDYIVEDVRSLRELLIEKLLVLND
jgi:HAD superfamily hydrolase (TIGR01549 family)